MLTRINAEVAQRLLNIMPTVCLNHRKHVFHYTQVTYCIYLSFKYCTLFVFFQMSLQTDIYEVCPSPLVLAQQLTHIELERLSMIGPEEFVQAFAKEQDKVRN